MDAAYRRALEKIKQAEHLKSTILYLSNMGLTELPSEIGTLVNLQSLSLRNNKLTSLPPEIGKLVNLQNLHLESNSLNTLPPQIGKLINLQNLKLERNLLRSLPPEIGNLASLHSLSIVDNALRNLPSEIGRLNFLQVLNLSHNELTSLPSHINKLNRLRYLYLDNNELTSLPSEIGNLNRLRELHLYNNQLTSLPPQIGRLTALQSFILDNNALINLPPEIGNLTDLKEFSYTKNPILSPPQAILDKGLRAIFAFFQEALTSRTAVWRSKLLVVGEGGVGKTSLIKRLQDKKYDPNEDKTHGIQIQDVQLPHPTDSDLVMSLTTWDFGGQEIYHATHQFFYSNRALFIVAWNARLGYEQGKLSYWLDTIQSLAPESPVLLVATYIDQHQPDLPLTDLIEKYPQIVGMVSISNATDEGIGELKYEVAQLAAQLPLMGEMWPETWRKAADDILAMNAKYTSPETIIDMVRLFRVDEYETRILLNWMHSLGDILYFEDNTELNDIVILEPEWVSKCIGDVLMHSGVVATNGIFTRDEMLNVWHDVEPYMQSILLRLMEQFDLSYIIPDDPENRSLIVERLSYEEASYQEQWQQLSAQNELMMRFRIPNSIMPAGIPTWFIARSHRFTTNTHWRTGSLFRDKTHQHYALVRAHRERRYIELAVRGTTPYSFFTLLRDGIDVTLDRFEGLEVKRMIPCPGHEGELCSYEFDLHAVERALSKKIELLQCQVTLEDVEVSKLLFGVRWRNAQEQVLERIDKLEDTLSGRFDELQEYIQREFTALFRIEQANIDTTCPNIFTISPLKADNWLASLYQQEMGIQLCCQAPGEWHYPLNENKQVVGSYVLKEPSKWIQSISPYLRRLIKILKFTTPITGSWLNMSDVQMYTDHFEKQLKFTQTLVDKLDELSIGTKVHDIDKLDSGRNVVIEGADLRVLRQLLDTLDPSQYWGGLRRVLTPEGHYLWLCEHHAKTYLDWVG
jgi:internalin A